MVEQEGRWTQEGALKLRYQPARDTSHRGNHYEWEGGTGLGMRVYRTGRRTWICATTLTDRDTRKQVPRFFTLGVVGILSLKDARIAASEKLNSMRAGIDPRRDEMQQRETHHREGLAGTTLQQALQFYLDNRNCAPSSKAALASCLRKNVSDWMNLPLLSIDTTKLQKRYRDVMARVQASGAQLEANYAQISADQRLLHAPNGYRNGIKTAHDTVEGVGRLYRYWTTKHMGVLQQLGVIVPPSPTAALIDDLMPQPQRVKGVPAADLGKLLRSLSSYTGNPFHPLLARFLLVSGLRVGAALNCKWEYVREDRICIPADIERAKVRWNKRHLGHMARIVPMTSAIRRVLNDLKRVPHFRGESRTWLFPSLDSKSGHIEEERAAAEGLRLHAGVRFTFHQFRHNVASAAEELGYGRAEIAELLGHTNGSVTDRYIDERVERHRAQLSAITANLLTLPKPTRRNAPGTRREPHRIA